jgi:hypothetical protein
MSWKYWHRVNMQNVELTSCKSEPNYYGVGAWEQKYTALKVPRRCPAVLVNSWEVDCVGMPQWSGKNTMWKCLFFGPVLPDIRQIPELCCFSW